MAELDKKGKVRSRGQNVAPHNFYSTVHRDDDYETTLDKDFAAIDKRLGKMIKRAEYDALVESGQVDPEQTYLIEEEE